MLKETKERKKGLHGLHYLGLNPRPSGSMQLTLISAYLNTLQCGGNALGVSNLNPLHIDFISNKTYFL
jgi:hypothetical protein